MIIDKCEHTWRKHTNASLSIDSGTIDATYFCEKCKSNLTASEVFQLEIILDTRTWQRGFNWVTITIALIALIVSIFK